jgi:O-antigen/teichoic acid export membrane protein
MGELGKRIVKNTSYLAFGNQLANLLQFVFFLYFGRLFGEAALGQYAFGFSFTFTFAIVADLGISIYLIREVACEKTTSRNLFFDAFILRLIFIIFVVIAAFIIVPLMSHTLSSEAVYIIILMGLYQIFFSLSEVILGELKGREEMAVVALLAVISKTLIVTCGFAFFALGVPYQIVLAAFPIGGFINLLACFYMSRYRLGPLTIKFGGPSHYYGLFLKALPFGSALLLHQAITIQDILILGFLSGDVAVGYYSVAIKIAGVILGMTIFLYETLLPVLTKLFMESRERLISASQRLLKYLLIIGLPLSVGMVMCADRFIVLLYQDKFAGSIVSLRIIGWIIGFGIIHTLLSAILTAIGKQSIKAVCWGINLTACVILNLVLTYFFSYLGTSMVRLFSEVLTTVLFVYLIAKYLSPLPLFGLSVKPILACVTMAAFIYVAHSWNLLALITLSALVYMASLLLLGTFTREEISSAKEFCAQRISFLALSKG